jgi:cell wall-associated NlpC family hydrolase
MNNEELVNLVYSVLGVKYESGSMGPDTFDCWGLVRHIQKEAFGRDLQIIEPPSDKVRDLIKFIKEHPEHQNWEKVDHPTHGGVVELSNSFHPNHVGVYLDIDGGGILHCSVAGVTFDPLIILKASGWRRFNFYKYKND